MKRLIIAVVCLGASVAQAKTVCHGPMPSWVQQHTEVSTNIPFAFRDPALKVSEFRIEFAPSPSNCVEWAAGRDCDGDGRLSATEAELVVAWDSGSWCVEGRDGPFLRVPGEEPLSTRTQMSVQLAMKAQTATNMVVRVEGESVGGPADDWLSLCEGSGEWDLVRVTVRGIGGAAERTEIRTERQAFVFIVK